jgi:hypothetical protein
MTRSSLIFKSVGLGLFLAGSVACGGGDTPPANVPESTPPAVDAGSTLAPTTTTETADAAASVATATPEPAAAPAPAALALPTGSAKLKFKTTKDFDLELKSDGTVNNAGKPAAKISGMELQDASGKSQLKVDSDGNITTSEGAPYAKFEGDTLATNTGAKYSIGDDGALQTTPEKGAAKSVGKTTDVGSAKRSALLSVAFVTWGLKAPQPAAAKTAAPKGEKTDAAAAKKPAADKKPAAEKAPAKK